MPCLNTAPRTICYVIYKSKDWFCILFCFVREEQVECGGMHLVGWWGKEFSIKERENTGQGGSAEGWLHSVCGGQMSPDQDSPTHTHTSVGTIPLAPLQSQNNGHTLWQFHYRGAVSPLEMLIYKSQKFLLSSITTAVALFKVLDRIRIQGLCLSSGVQ
jgi:hypothetical protein